MRDIKFELQIYCTTGWDDEESIALLQVYTFSKMLEVINVLNTSEQNRSEEARQMFENLKDEMESENGEEIMYIGEVTGIQCIYEDEKGIRAKMTLDDDMGIEGKVNVNSQEHNNENKRLLNEAKKLATKIVSL